MAWLGLGAVNGFVRKQFAGVRGNKLSSPGLVSPGVRIWLLFSGAFLGNPRGVQGATSLVLQRPCVAHVRLLGRA